MDNVDQKTEGRKDKTSEQPGEGVQENVKFVVLMPTRTELEQMMADEYNTRPMRT